MASLEEQLSRTLAEIQLLDQVIEEIRTRVNTLRTLITEHEGAANFIDELIRRKGGLHLLVPIGGGNYIHADVRAVDKVEVSIGAGVVLTKSVEEGKKLIEKRRENLLKTVKAYEEKLNQYIQRASELRRLAEIISAKIREEEKTKSQ